MSLYDWPLAAILPVRGPSGSERLDRRGFRAEDSGARPHPMPLYDWSLTAILPVRGPSGRGFGCTPSPHAVEDGNSRSRGRPEVGWEPERATGQPNAGRWGGGAVGTTRWGQQCRCRMFVLRSHTTRRRAAGQPSLRPAQPSHRRDCHSADIPSPSVLKRLLKREGGAAE